MLRHGAAAVWLVMPRVLPAPQYMPAVCFRFPEGMMGGELTERFRQQSERFGTKIFSETVTKVRRLWIFKTEMHVTGRTLDICCW